MGALPWLTPGTSIDLRPRLGMEELIEYPYESNIYVKLAFRRAASLAAPSWAKLCRHAIEFNFACHQGNPS
jgi:hypothetical protein